MTRRVEDKRRKQSWNIRMLQNEVKTQHFNLQHPQQQPLMATIQHAPALPRWSPPLRAD